jgi:hypothetical protein
MPLVTGPGGLHVRANTLSRPSSIVTCGLSGEVSLVRVKLLRQSDQREGGDIAIGRKGLSCSVFDDLNPLALSFSPL